MPRGNGDDETSEGDKLMRLMAKCPSLAKALDGAQTTFDDEGEPTDNDLLLVARVTDSPVQIEGRLAPDGIGELRRISYQPAPRMKPPPKPPLPI